MATAQDVHYLTYDMLTNTLVGEVNFGQVSFTNKLNGGGSFSGTIALKEQRNRLLDPYNATLPGKTILVVVVNGSIEWQGIIVARSYTQSSGDLTVSGVELEGYLGKLQQTRGYSTKPHGWSNYGLGSSTSQLVYSAHPNSYWKTNPVPPIMAATQVVGDTLSDLYSAYNAIPALSVSSSSILNTAVNANFAPGTYPDYVWHTSEKLPLANRTSLDQLITTLATEHVTAGFDWQWSAAFNGTSALSFSLDFWWPRLGFDCTGGNGGALGSNSTPAFTIDSAEFLDYSFPEDSSQQATRVFALSGGTKGHRLGIGDATYGTVINNSLFFEAALHHGTPVTVYVGGTGYNGNIKKTTAWGVFGYRWKVTWSGGAPTLTNGTAIQAVVQGGPTAAGYPPMQKTSSYTHVKTGHALQNQAFMELAVLEWPITTPTVKVDAFGPSGFGGFSVGDDVRVILNPDERFVAGLDTYWRATQADWTIADSGQSTVTYSFTMPPSSDYTHGGFPGFQPPYQ